MTTTRLGVRLRPSQLAGLILCLGITLHSMPNLFGEQAGQPSGFKSALPGYPFTFPQDHGAHPRFRTEWWYYTGHLSADDGRRFGYELTFFRRELRPRQDEVPGQAHSKWRLDELFLAHLAISDIDGGRFRYAEKLSREGLGKAGAEADRLHVWIDRWHADMDPAEPSPHRLEARTDAIGLDLELISLKPPVVHGAQGVSQKGSDPGHASHYYSLTRLQSRGTLTIEGHRIPVTGESWMDHEFGSGDLGENLVGWDWFGVQLESGEELMLYRLRRSDGRIDPASSGTWIDRQGRAHLLSSEAMQVEVLESWTSPHSRARYPSRWRVTIPLLNLMLEVAPLLADQELRTTRSTQITYWEGAVRVSGTRQLAPVSGKGYVELTGYAEPYRPRL